MNPTERDDMACLAKKIDELEQSNRKLKEVVRAAYKAGVALGELRASLKLLPDDWREPVVSDMIKAVAESADRMSGDKS